MKFLVTTFALVLSLNVFALDSYKLNQALCDGNPVDMSAGVKDFSMMINLFTANSGSLDMILKDDSQGTEIMIDMKTPFLIENTTNNRYAMKNNGPLTCTITFLGQTQDCSNDAESDLPKEEFTMVKTDTMLKISFQNYTDDEQSCNEFNLNFNRL